MRKFNIIFGGKDPDFQQNCDIIRKYIFLQTSHGISEKEIRSKLRKNGWSRAHLKEGFRLYEAEQASKERDEPLRFREHANDGDSLIRIEDLSVSFGGKQVLKDINMDIKAGDLIGVIGLSGSGKSTLINSLIGFYRPDSGQVLYNVDGNFNPVLTNKKYIRNIFGLAPQQPSFYRRLSIWENLDHFGSLYKIKRKDRRMFMDKILKQMGLDDVKQTLGYNLSGGMQRRLSIACSLIHQPKVLILDEPTADLDPYMRKEIWKLISDINKMGTTVFLTSHFLSEVEGLCHKIAILHESKIKAFGSPDQLKDSFSSNQEIEIELEGGDYTGIIEKIQKRKLGVNQILHRDNKLVIYSPNAESILHSIIHIVEKNKQKLKDINLNRPSLNEIFESYVAK